MLRQNCTGTRSGRSASPRSSECSCGPARNSADALYLQPAPSTITPAPPRAALLSCAALNAAVRAQAGQSRTGWRGRCGLGEEEPAVSGRGPRCAVRSGTEKHAWRSQARRMGRSHGGLGESRAEIRQVAKDAKSRSSDPSLRLLVTTRRASCCSANLKSPVSVAPAWS